MTDFLSNFLAGALAGSFSGAFVFFAIQSGYEWFMRGKIEINKSDFYHPHIHNKKKISRHRIAILNMGNRSLKNLTAFITFHNLESIDLAAPEDHPHTPFISPDNFRIINQNQVPFDNQAVRFNLNPSQITEIDLFTYEKTSGKLVLHSELGYYEPRAIIGNLNKNYQFYLQFFADNYQTKKHHFELSLKNDNIAISYLGVF